MNNFFTKIPKDTNKKRDVDSLFEIWRTLVSYVIDFIRLNGWNIFLKKIHLYITCTETKEVSFAKTGFSQWKKSLKKNKDFYKHGVS